MAEQEGVFPKLKRFKARTQAAVDSKMQEIANRANEAGYTNLGAGVAAAGSTLAGEALDYVPESPADAAMSAAGPLGRKLKGMGRIIPDSMSKQLEALAKEKGIPLQELEKKVKQLFPEKMEKPGPFDRGGYRRPLEKGE